MAKKKTSKNKKTKKKSSPSVSIKVTDANRLIDNARKHACSKNVNCGSGGCFYFLGALGSAIYYISTAAGFWAGVLGVLKAIVWPAFLVFELMKFIGM